MTQLTPKRDIVLLGAGHTNAHIIRMWRMNPLLGARLTCISNFPIATYSGMLPGTLAGQYNPERMQIDLVRLCASCGVRLVLGEVIGLDPNERRLRMRDRPAIDFDLLSIGIGSRPHIPDGVDSEIAIKPMQKFLARLQSFVDNFRREQPEQPIHFAVVGGGAAGVEIALCLHKFLKRNEQLTIESRITLVSAGDELLEGMPNRTQQLAQQELEACGIQVRLNSRVTEFADGNLLVFDNGESMAVDTALWATSARPPELLNHLNLPLDNRGFLATRNTLQSTGCDEVFAVGDSGTVVGQRYAKAGVYAVRQAPILWTNLQRKLQDTQLQKWHPQSSFLSLLNTGDERAILTYGPLSICSRSAWKLKDWIDSRFMAKYQAYDAPMMAGMEDQPEAQFLSKQCGGCGSKTSARVLQQSLPALQQSNPDHVLMGLDQPDDVALVAQRDHKAIAASTDFFTAFVDDPYLLGRIAALNAMSDLFAKGATPRAALSIAVLPADAAARQATLLEELLAGAVREFGTLEVPIVGGHTITGSKLTFGFTILGDADPQVVLRKATPSAGDHLVLTKPLGTGVLLAAHMQADCRAEWWTPLIDSMLQSNLSAANLARDASVSAATDVTGFGLAGHLVEMLTGTNLSADVSLGALPLLPGALELLERGIESTLAPDSRASCQAVRISPELQNSAATNILFDPQTSGGLLLAVPEEKLDDLLNRLKAPAAVIGRVAEASDQAGAIQLQP